MTKAQRATFITVFSTILYCLLLWEYIEVPVLDDKAVQEVLPVMPWWLLVSFGSYSLWSLGMGIFTFRDCPEAYQELLQEISEAKNDLRSRGVTVD